MIAKGRSAVTDVHVVYNIVALVMMHTATCVIDARHPSRRRPHPEYISQKTPETVETVETSRLCARLSVGSSQARVASTTG